MTLLLTLALCLACQAPEPGPGPVRPAGPAAPRSRPAALRPAPGLPPTRLAAELLSQDPVVVVARTESTVVAGPGLAVVRLRVERQLFGPTLGPADGVVVLAYPGHFRPGGRDLVYLRPFRGGRRFRPIQMVDGRDPHWQAKLAVTEAQTALAREPDAGRRDADTITRLLAWLDDNDPWVRDYALAEWRWIAANRPDVMTPTRRARLTAAGARSPHDAVRRGVESVARALAAASDA